MRTEDPYWQQYRLLVESQLGWGASEQWQQADFERLSERIFAQTQVTISTSTLRRLWGRVRYDHLPSVTTLNTLAQFIGHPDWRAFRQWVDELSTAPPAPQPIPRFQPASPGQGKAWRVLLGSLVLTGLVVAWVVASRGQSNRPINYQFASRPVTRSIPNSVVFTYDATRAPTDSVSIQQSWDPARRQVVGKQAHEFTALYYYPGTYEARLLVGSRVVGKHALLIPTQGWLGLIDRKPVPIYLPPRATHDSTGLQVSLATIQANGVGLQPDPPAVHFYNVGNFAPVSSDNFVFSCQLQNRYGQGAGICQHSTIVLFTERSAISIPLSQKGCISSLKLLAIDTLINGQSTNLSGFGTAFRDWVKVRCEGDKGWLRFYVDDRLAYQLAASKRTSHIVGMGYGFTGTGAVRQIRLFAGKRLVYSAF